MTRDPWAVLVSEVMLQQTQVHRVVGPFVLFMARFPTPGACAAAGAADVVRQWEGLGYNRRAVRLHAAAAATVERHEGRVPADETALRRLPGIGPCTARAVMAFAFEQPVGVVDVNVARVLVRAVVGRPSPREALQRLADDLVPKHHAWLWNQGVMELGARLCRARAPQCGRCPLRRHCRWRASVAAPDPAVAPSRAGVFEGSQRQGRGRLVAALRRGDVTRRALAAACGWPGDERRARMVAEALVADGLARVDGDGTLTLP